MENHTRDGCTVIVSGAKCMIVSEAGKVVTVYELPRWFNQTPNLFSGKEKIRNAKRFYKNNPDDFREIA